MVETREPLSSIYWRYNEENNGTEHYAGKSKNRVKTSDHQPQHMDEPNEKSQSSNWVVSILPNHGYAAEGV